jgi:hypothetical protein
MKRFLILFFVFLMGSRQIVHSQVTEVFDAAVGSLLTKMGIDQYIHYGQMVLDNISQINQLTIQAEYSAKAYQQAYNNLSRIGDIKSYDDFWNWYNRQLYLERRSREVFESMNVTVGSKKYAFTDIEGIAHGLDETYVQYWNNEFTEEQRKAMWLNLGLTPANYAYRQIWQEKEADLARKFLTLSEIQNEEYMAQMGRGKAKKDRLAMDALAEQDNKIGEKELAALNLDTNIDSNKILNDIAMMTAAQLELQAADYYSKQTPIVSPVFADWTEDGFRPLDPVDLE